MEWSNDDHIHICIKEIFRAHDENKSEKKEKVNASQNITMPYVHALPRVWVKKSYECVLYIKCSYNKNKNPEYFARVLYILHLSVFIPKFCSMCHQIFFCFGPQRAARSIFMFSQFTYVWLYFTQNHSIYSKKKLSSDAPHKNF